MPKHIPVQDNSNGVQDIPVRTPAEKRRATIIRTKFNGDEQAYMAWQRENASKAGKKGGRPFSDPDAARRAANKRWGN